MIRLLLILTQPMLLLGAPTSTNAAAELASSTFDTNDEGWRAVDRVGSSAATVTDRGIPSYNRGGNPGGYISFRDGDDQYYFRAPAKFLGDKSAAYDGFMSFDLFSDLDGGASLPAAGVVLSNGTLTIYTRLPTGPREGAWTPYKVSLKESGWFVVGTESPVTADEMKGVLSSLTFLDILGEFGEGGGDIGAIDNVLLNSSIADGGELPATSDEESGITIAVLDFANLGPSVELAPLRDALAEMLTADLWNISGLQIMERRRVAELLEEKDLGKSGLVEGSSIGQIGDALAAEYLLMGSFSAADSTITVRASLVNVETGKTIDEWTLSRPANELFQLESELKEKLLASLEISNPSGSNPPEPTENETPVVAVLGLRNLSTSARLDPMESGFADILQANLSAIPTVRLVERKDLDAVLKEQELSQAELVDPSTAVRVGRLLGAERLIYGSFVEVDKQIRFDARVVDTLTAGLSGMATTTGSVDEFAKLEEELAIQLARHLAVPVSDDMLRRVKAASPVSTMEAALHYSEAERTFRQGRFDASAAAFQRVLLLEPGNLHAALGRMRAWYQLGKYHEAMEAGEQALNSEFMPEQRDIKMNILIWLANSYWATEKYDRHIEICQRLIREHKHYSFRLHMALSLSRVQRHAEAVAVLEEDLQQKSINGDDDQYASALFDALNFLTTEVTYVRLSTEHRRRQSDPQYLKQFSAQTRQSAEMSLKVLDRILDEAESNPTERWRDLAWESVRFSINMAQYVDENGYPRAYLSSQQKVDLITRAKNIVGEDFHEAVEILRELTLFQQIILKNKAKSEPEDVIAWRTLAEQHLKVRDGLPKERGYWWLPDRWDNEWGQPGRWMDLRIEAQFQVGRIHHRFLDEPEKAVTAHQELVRLFGITNFRGVNVAQALNELDAEIEFPRRAALVWGGGDAAVEAYRGLLAPLGYTVHNVGQNHLSGAHLSPYSLVILVRTGMMPYYPADILALQNFVASGGSLLCIVSPGWEHAQPGIHNPLLAFFGAHAGDDMVVTAESTHVVQHPITKGIHETMGKNGIDIKVPANTALIKAGDRTILAALPYRKGRVVLASFAQWFLPDPDVPERYSGFAEHWTTRLTSGQVPIERGDGLELPLLRRVLNWLTDDIGSGHDGLAEIQATSLKAQFQVVSPSQLTASLDRIVATLPHDELQEQSLWAAGEACLMLSYHGREDQPTRDPRYDFGSEPHELRPQYFQQLVNQFPDSPLRPFAEWRLADCYRRILVHDGSYTDSKDSISSADVIKKFEKVQADVGTYVWAWRELRLGELKYAYETADAAVPHFRAVAEQMGSGPEQMLAILNLAICYEATGNNAEARRYYKVSLERPNVTWWTDDFESWTPLERKARHQGYVKRQLQQLEVSSQ